MSMTGVGDLPDAHTGESRVADEMGRDQFTDFRRSAGKVIEIGAGDS